MGSQEEESFPPPSWKDAAMKELAQGRDFVSKLSALLQIGSPESGRSEKTTAELLIKEIMGTMNKAMAALESGGTMEVNRVADPSSCVDSSKEGAGGKSKVQSTRKAGYRRRGCPYSWTRLTSKTIDDGHTWRKYGQKEIFSAKYPRSYFRCTHKFDQGCKASKQVQRSEDDPSSFVITYFGEHTCVDARKATIPPSREPCIISFESSNGDNVKQETPSSFPSLNQEGEEEVLSNLTSADSASDYFVSHDAEFTKPAQEEPAAVIGQEHNGLPSAPYSSFINYGMELLDYDDIFNFDHTDLFQG
uniref:WRKY transcription factor 29-like n=1 Tax=Cymbidium sinense TaxID=112615 RepID=A0A2P1JML7_9ASPA|nr:WRKY transcription factor 29-like [Cymbidium sinense]